MLAMINRKSVVKF